MADVATVAIDERKAEAFAERMLGAIDAAGVTLMTSIGHRTGLFDAMADMPPATSQAIADRAGLDERYVREWLGAMVAGRVVDYDPHSGTYALPPEHASVLTRSAAPDNMAAIMQWIAVLGSVEDEIVDCFRQGGGVPYAFFDRFHQVMAEDSGQTVVAALLDHILPLVPGLTQLLQRGIDVLDVGCGAGRALCLLAETFPNSRFTGYDLCSDATGMALAEARARGLANVRFETKDVTVIGESEAFDLVTAFDAIHDQAAPATVLGQIAAALRPDGTFLMQDIGASSHVEKNIDHPIGAFLYTISCMHCMTVSLAQGGAGLGTCWGVELAETMLRDAGFTHVDVKRLPHDFMNVYYVAKRR